MPHRFFRASVDVYESMRIRLNSAWSIPNSGITNCILPATDPTVPQDSQGRVYLAVHSEWCEWPDVAAILPGLLDAGDVEEVDRSLYVNAMPESL